MLRRTYFIHFLICVTCPAFIACVSTNVTDSVGLLGEKEVNNTLFIVYPSFLLFAHRFLPIAVLFDRYISLVYYVIGLPGNLFSLIVWTSRNMYKNNSAAVYLSALAINDFVVLIMALERDVNRAWGYESRRTPGSCQMIELINLTAQYSSPLFVLGFTVERWLAICRPFLIDRICSTIRSIYICCLITFGTMFSCCGILLIFFTEQNKSCEKRQEYRMFGDVYMALLEALFSATVPLLVLLFNCSVIRELARIHRSNQRLTSDSTRLSCNSGEINFKNHTHVSSVCPNRHRPTNGCSNTYERVDVTIKTSTPSNGENAIKQKSFDGSVNIAQPRNKQIDRGVSENETASRSARRFRTTTFMLLIVSFYMILSYLLGGLCHLLHQLEPTPSLNVTETQALSDPSFDHYMKVMTVKTIGDEMALSYFAFHFIIYYASGHAFRQRVHELLRLLCIRCGCNCEKWIPTDTSEEVDRITSSRRIQRRPLITDNDPTDQLDNNASSIEERVHHTPKNVNLSSLQNGEIRHMDSVDDSIHKLVVQ